MVFPFHKLKLLAIQREREKEKREGGGCFWSFTRVLFTLKVEIAFFNSPTRSMAVLRT
jgi:hypothetical protein